MGIAKIEKRKTRTDRGIESIASTPVSNWYLFYGNRMDKSKVRTRRKLNSAHSTEEMPIGICTGHLTILTVHQLYIYNDGDYFTLFLSLGLYLFP